MANHERDATDDALEENLAEIDGDGPADTVGLQVYSTAQRFASM